MRPMPAAPPPPVSAPSMAPTSPSETRHRLWSADDFGRPSGQGARRLAVMPRLHTRSTRPCRVPTVTPSCLPHVIAGHRYPQPATRLRSRTTSWLWYWRAFLKPGQATPVTTDMRRAARPPQSRWRATAPVSYAAQPLGQPTSPAACKKSCRFEMVCHAPFRRRGGVGERSEDDIVQVLRTGFSHGAAAGPMGEVIARRSICTTACHGAHRRFLPPRPRAASCRTRRRHGYGARRTNSVRSCHGARGYATARRSPAMPR